MQWFKMRPILDETAALERFLSWSNCIFAVIWDAISTLEWFFHIATETAIVTESAIAIETAFWILGCNFTFDCPKECNGCRPTCWVQSGTWKPLHVVVVVVYSYTVQSKLFTIVLISSVTSLIFPKIIYMDSTYSLRSALHIQCLLWHSKYPVYLVWSL